MRLAPDCPTPIGRWNSPRTVEKGRENSKFKKANIRGGLYAKPSECLLRPDLLREDLDGGLPGSDKMGGASLIQLSREIEALKHLIHLKIGKT